MNSSASTATPVPVRWGILGAARIAEAKTIPAMKASTLCQLQAIGSRDIQKARAMADEFGIAAAYGSYEEVINDPLVEAVYIALPNHLHVKWARAAALKGKHVLCEKPMAMSAAEARQLEDVPPDVRVSEAFMVRQQPRWQRLREILRSGDYGQPKTVHSLLSFFMNNPEDFRNTPAFGGGALYDLGCYTVMTARFVFGQEPVKVMAIAEPDPVHGVDMFSSAILDFGQGRHAVFTVSTAMASSQTLQVVCEKGFIDLPKSYVPARNEPSHIHVDISASHDLSDVTTTSFEPLDQYMCEVTNFSKAVRGDTSTYFGIEDAIANARVLDTIFASIKSGQWEHI